MERVFLELFNMSITAGWLVLAVIIIRLLLKNAPKFIRCIMWALVGIRLICPFSFESSLSLVPSAETVPQEIIYSQTPAIDSGVSVLNQTVNPIISDSLAPEIGASVNPVQVVLFVASVLWIAGIAAMLIYTLISYIRIHRRVREAIELNDNVWICDHIDTPFIFGVFRPRIFLPSSMNEADMRYVISHERAHLSRYDHLWKPVGFLLLTVYWFNPVLWIAYILLCRDIEMACDEKVIKEMGIENKKSYSEALINCSVPRKMIAACPLAFGEVSVKSRIKGVLNYKKPAFWLVITSVVSCIVVAVCFLTNPSGIKLNQLKEDISFENLFDNVERLEVVSGEMGYATEEPGTIADVINILKEVKISRNPISKSRAEDRDRTNTITINNGDTLCFSKDCSEYWVYTGVKPTFSYKVMNPETVKKVFEIEKVSSFSGTIDSKYYFDATVLETGTTILVEPFEEAQERKSSDKIYVSTNVSGEQAVPELKVGDEVRIYYDGLIMETYPAQIGNVYEICLLKDVLAQESSGEENTSEPETEPQTEEITTEEVTTEATTEETTEETTAVVYTYTEMNQVMYATTSLNMRSGPSADFDKVGMLSQAEEVTVIAQCNETGWYKLNYSSEFDAYVNSSYLSATKPVIETEPVETATAEADSSDISNMLSALIEQPGKSPYEFCEPTTRERGGKTYIGFYCPEGYYMIATNGWTYPEPPSIFEECAALAGVDVKDYDVWVVGNYEEDGLIYFVAFSNKN